MKIISDPDKDVRTISLQSGGYEWWYFDAISSDDQYSLVVIFYEGNPFSTRYNKMILSENSNPYPSAFPAVSISIYEDGSPIYYSFTEFDSLACTFDENEPNLKVGPHHMETASSEGRLVYKLRLRETLPSADKIDAAIVFDSPRNTISFPDNQTDKTTGHHWNLVQPQAVVKADIRLESKNEEPRGIHFEGTGYHDHNTGQEPMRNEFSDWYWGRFHFDYGTLVYYIMNRKGGRQHRAWLFGKDNKRIVNTLDNIELEDEGFTLFGLKTARKLRLKSEDIEIHVQQSRLLDNGPFYQRYQSDAFLSISKANRVDSQTGITEYIKPGRIYNRIFWPFVDMRLRYTEEGAHWVQRSKRLYRWTW